MSREVGRAMSLDQWQWSVHTLRKLHGGGLNPRFHLDSLVSPLRSYLTVVCGLSVVRHIEKPVLGLLPSHIQVQKHFVLNYNCLFYHSVVSLSYLRTAMSVGRLVNYGRRN